MSSELKKRKVPNVEPKGPPTDMSLEENNDTQDMLQSLKAVLEQNQVQMTKMQSEIDGMKERISHVDKLEKKCTHLEDKCTSLEKSVEVLIKHWKHSNPPRKPERSYWIDKGHEDSYIVEVVDEFFNDIDNVISKIVQGCFNMNLGWDDEGTSLIHDTAFLAHWEKLMDALKLCSHLVRDENISLFIGYIQLAPSTLMVLKKGLQVTKLTSLRLLHNDFPEMREALEGIIGIVNTQSSMTEFIWDNNTIDNMNDANYLFESIKQHPSINSIQFENSCGENVNGYNLLCSLIDGDKTFDSIDLDGNGICTMGNTHLPDYIATNSRLQTLHLSGNGLNDNDATLIAIALRQNTNLRQLHLCSNDGITQIGYDALTLAIFDSTSLNSTVDSNHTCTIEMHGVVPNHNTSSEETNRGAKIYSILSSRHREGTSVHHLDSELGDDSLGLVPHVLSCMQRCSDSNAVYNIPRLRIDQFVAVRPLSIFFELLKSWHMPALYETRKRGRAEVEAVKS